VVVMLAGLALWRCGVFKRAWVRGSLVLAPACIGLAASLLTFERNERVEAPPDGLEEGKGD
jgi:hypothetical protein